MTLPSVVLLLFLGLYPRVRLSVPHYRCRTYIEHHTEEDVGLLVQVGFDITAFTPPAYQRGSLPRPSKDVSS